RGGASRGGGGGGEAGGPAGAGGAALRGAQPGPAGAGRGGEAMSISMIDIEAARGRVRDSIYTSPLAYSETFSRLTGNRAFFKLENLQMTGSFKERGALNKVLSLTPEERARGVVAASAGN